MESLVRFWYSRSPLARLAAPLSALSHLVYGVRRVLYRCGALPTTRMRVPVVIVGNITVGGTGKTPLVSWLAVSLQRAGFKPGIVCGAYKATAEGPASVHPSSDPRVHGDEAVLLARAHGCPVWSGPDRLKTAVALTTTHPDVDVLVCDDGLQHLALARDCEIAVIDGTRALGNGMLIPAGPLREPRTRLAEVDAIVVNGAAADIVAGDRSERFTMRLEGETLHNLVDRTRRAGAASFAGRRVAAIAGIGNPARFFEHLRSIGIEHEPRPFPDHHRYAREELETIATEVIVMTEKDAIKCAAFGDDRMWVLPVSAIVSDGLLALVIERIGRHAKRAGPRKAGETREA
jgi:tetraacyldisaccharide 4'-kinase